MGSGLFYLKDLVVMKNCFERKTGKIKKRVVVQFCFRKLSSFIDALFCVSDNGMYVQHNNYITFDN